MNPLQNVGSPSLQPLPAVVARDPATSQSVSSHPVAGSVTPKIIQWREWFLHPVAILVSLIKKLFYIIKNLFVSPATNTPVTTPPLTLEYQKLIDLDHPTPDLFAVAQRHQDRNRYGNILPSEPTRFQLDEHPNFYFNANWVLDRSAIACQGPLENEIGEFWQMAWHADVRAIVMLANPLESGYSKCSQYWKDANLSSSIGPIKISLLSQKTLFEKDSVKIVLRTIKVHKADQTKTICQYHLQNWPDFGVVQEDVLAKLIEIVAGADTDKPFIAHCSAGVGRTGAFLAALQAYRKQTSDIFPIACHLRNPATGRVGLIQTQEQYVLAKKTAQLFFF